MAANGLAEGNSAILPRLLDPAQRDTILEDGEGAFATAFDQGGHQIAIVVHLAHAMCLNGALALLRDVRLDLRPQLLQQGCFILLQRRPAFARDTTGTLARIEVADEPFVEEVFADECAAVFDHAGSKIRPLGRSIAS